MKFQFLSCIHLWGDCSFLSVPLFGLRNIHGMLFLFLFLFFPVIMVVCLTQNYLKLFLKCIERPHKENKPDGLLIHCISGWDRTPLFISLLRISLWADGEVHSTLSPLEMLYLTVAYDWLLFSHLLSDRTQRGEDIFYFCFYVLKFIIGEEFSISKAENQRDRMPLKRISSSEIDKGKYLQRRKVKYIAAFFSQCLFSFSFTFQES